MGFYLCNRTHPSQGIIFCFPSISLFSCSVMSDSLQSHWLLLTRLLCLWDSPGKNTGVGCHFLLQRIFPTQGSNPCLLHCRWILYHWTTGEAPGYNKETSKFYFQFSSENDFFNLRRKKYNEKLLFLLLSLYNENLYAVQLEQKMFYWHMRQPYWTCGAGENPRLRRRRTFEFWLHR